MKIQRWISSAIFDHCLLFGYEGDGARSTFPKISTMFMWALWEIVKVKKTSRKL